MVIFYKYWKNVVEGSLTIMEAAVRHVCCLCSITRVLLTTTLLLPLFLTSSSGRVCGSSNHVITSWNECAQSIITPGVTFPQGDIIIEYGNPLEIFCILDPTKTDYNSSSLYFEYYDDKGVYEFPPENLEIVNFTTLRLYIKKPLPDCYKFYCKLRRTESKSDTVCFNTVAVGFKPQEVKNFSCVSMNWENLTCTWDVPMNYVKTTTKLEYYLPGRAGGRFYFPCPDNTDERDHRCFWDRSTTVVYRQPYEYYFFIMNISNVFGSITQKMKFHHYAYVIPSKPVNLTLVSKTSSSIMIQWSVGFPMQNFPPGIAQKVEYQSLWDSRDVWHAVNTSHLSVKNHTHMLNITGLKYAHTNYDIRVYMRSPVSTGVDKWSKPAAITVKTLPTVPSAPPKTDIGSFETSRGIPTRDVYVYWQQIPECMWNGDNFTYLVMSVDESGKEVLKTPDKVEKSYARFKTLGLKEYHLRIYSANNEGLSETGSDVYIPAAQDVIPEPLTFTKIDFDNGMYELSWQKPTGNPKVENYTIFWCQHDKDRPYPCLGYLNWTHVGTDVNIHNITVPEKNKTYQFAVSANSYKKSSGMVWASCTVMHNKDTKKMKSVWISSIGSTFIEVGWKLECSDRVGVVKGFRIYYCPIAALHVNECKDGIRYNTTVMGDPPLTGHGNVTALIPYTTYMLTIAVLTKSGEGVQSEILRNTTLENAPDPPQNVRITDVTNTSMVVEWDAPLNINGILRFYLVDYASESQPLKVESTTRVTLKDLKSYYIYNVTVSACTVTCSEVAVAPSTRTLAGVPGIMIQPDISAKHINGSQLLVKWEPPLNPSGLIDYYEVKLMQSSENGNESEIRRVYGTSAIIEMECEVDHVGQILNYMVYVRAVNVRAEDNTTFPGPWSSPGTRTCYADLPKWVHIVIGIFIIMALIALIFGFAYTGKWLMTCLKSMANVSVKVPPELIDPTCDVQEKDNLDCQQMHDTFMGKLDPKINNHHHPSPDQEKLQLLKMTENDCFDGDRDSSGCSSAHESVSSSLTSGTQISDSGTEVDQSPDGCAFPKLESSPPPMLQERNFSSTYDGTRVPDPYVTMPSGSEVSPSSTESDSTYSTFLNRGIGYCKVGNPPSLPQGYVSISQPSNISTPTLASDHGYVLHPAAWSENKDSVTPVTTTLLAPASKGYVVAGSLSEAQTHTKHPSTSYCRLGTVSDYVTLPSTSKDPCDL
ncbi:cytokine receptor domeless isoform X2 [Lycorma delicatula]|uniref:cytokine receptor domeless isoform X2 n=1 Tax=Lycorma delicatula TaxID=130591 RepID=UPI003F514B3C